MALSPTSRLPAIIGTTTPSTADQVQPGDTCDSIALGLGAGGGAAPAGANGQTDAAEHPNGADIATPVMVGSSGSWTFTAADASAAVSSATVGASGTALALADGTRITLFGASLSVSQIGVS